MLSMKYSMTLSLSLYTNKTTEILLQEISLTLLQAFHPDTIELGIIYDLSTVPLVLKESQKLVPCDHGIIPVVEFVNKPL